MLNVLLSHLNTREEILISLPAEMAPWQVFRYVRTHHPEFCFLESWEAPAAVGEAIAPRGSSSACNRRTRR